MTEFEQTNSDLKASMGRVHERLDDMVKAMTAQQQATSSQHLDLSKSIGTLAVAVAETKGAAEDAKRSSAENKTAIAELSTKVGLMELKDAKQDGERGVWVALANSSAAKWLATLVAAVGIFFTGKSS